MDYDTKCPLRRAIKILGGKWNMIIIKHLQDGELRLSQLRRLIPDISEKVLIDKLKELVQYGIVIRKDYKEIPPRVGYKLTGKGIKASRLVLLIEEFGEKEVGDI